MRHKIHISATERPNAPSSREYNGLVGGRDDQPDLEQILNSIVVTCGDPARVLELFYWSQEPEVLEVIRWLVALPGESREALCAFLTSVPDPQWVSVEVDLRGHLTLNFPESSRAMPAIPNPAAKAG